MKTTYKVLLGLLVVAVIWIFLDRAVAQGSVATLRAELVAKHAQPPLRPEKDYDVFTASFALSSSVDLSGLWEDLDKLLQLMRLMPGGRAHVTWQEEALHTQQSMNVWPETLERLTSVDTELRLLIDAVDDSSGMSEADRTAVLQQGQIAHAWLGVAASAQLHSQDPTAALPYLKTMLRHANKTNLNWMWAQDDIGAYGAHSFICSMVNRCDMSESRTADSNFIPSAATTATMVVTAVTSFPPPRRRHSGA